MTQIFISRKHLDHELIFPIRPEYDLIFSPHALSHCKDLVSTAVIRKA